MRSRNVLSHSVRRRTPRKRHSLSICRQSVKSIWWKITWPRCVKPRRKFYCEYICTEAGTGAWCHQIVTSLFDFHAFRSILSSTKFFDANSRELKLTSMYVFLKPKYKPNDGTFATSEHFEWRDRFELPANCRITVLNIENIKQTTDDNCCKNLNIFNDTMKIGEKISTEVNAAHMMAIENEQHSINGFYECKISIKGFRDQLIKGKSIWTQ